MVISQISKRTIFPIKKQQGKGNSQNKEFVIKQKIKKETN
jgi:hypothetical protein